MVAAQDIAHYEIAITNITPEQIFTPQLVITHPGNYFMFRLGEPASEELEILAQGGDEGYIHIGNERIENDVMSGRLINALPLDYREAITLTKLRKMLEANTL